MSAAKAQTQQADEKLTIGNNLMELTFDVAKNGALVSLLDKVSGYQFLRDADAPRALFRLALRRKADRELVWLDSREAKMLRWETRQDTNDATLHLEVSALPEQDMKIEVDISIADNSPFSVWRARISNVRTDEAVYQFTCPILSGVMQVGATSDEDTIVFPRQGEGFVFKNPYPMVDRLPLKAGVGPDTPNVGMGELHGKYPGNIPVQLMLYYNDQAGLYCATHDASQQVKTFDIGQMADWGMFPIMSVSHFPSEQMGGDITFDYETIIGVFHGDWYDGVDIYKSWARQQWWCEKRLWERDIADWIRKGFGVFQMSNYHLPVLKLNHTLSQIADVVNGLSRDIGVPILSLIFNFEGCGGWTGPVGFFPPREGEEAFREAMQRLRDAGNYGFVYMPGGNYYIAISSYTPPFDSWPQFEAEGRPNAVMHEKGEINIGRWYTGWESTRVCPHTEFTMQMTQDLLLGCVRRGCPVVQIDNFPCGGADACYDPKHGHPLGFGSWWSEDWNRILAETRRKAKELHPACAITTEGISENFIPYLDLYDQRAGNMEYFGHWAPGDPMGGETIPLFGYIYSGYIGAYLAAYPECNRPEVLYWTRAMGKALAQGVVPTGGWYFPEPNELNPITIGFYKKVTRAAAQECWKYIMFGEMLRPPKIQVPTITASYLKMTSDCGAMDPNNRHVVTDAAVQHSAWRASDGTLGYIFVNVSEEPVAFDVQLSAYGEDAESFTLECVTDGKRETLKARTKLPMSQRVTTEPLSVVLIEVREHV